MMKEKIKDDSADAIAVTPEMVEAGEDAVLGEIGGADLGGYFSASDLAIKVFRAMAAADLSRRYR
jgi:outer membrane lipoprotein SlyB